MIVNVDRKCARLRIVKVDSRMPKACNINRGNSKRARKRRKKGHASSLLSSDMV